MIAVRLTTVNSHTDEWTIEALLSARNIPVCARIRRGLEALKASHGMDTEPAVDLYVPAEDSKRAKEVLSGLTLIDGRPICFAGDNEEPRVPCGWEK